MPLSLRRRAARLRRRIEAHAAAGPLGSTLFGQAILHPGHFAAAGVAQDGFNINGPSVIEVPAWIPVEDRAHPEARFYLYFAHHLGAYLRMAWARSVQGPWHLYNVGRTRDPRRPGRGVLDLDRANDLAWASGARIASTEGKPIHVASPDVHVDHEARRIVLLAHAPTVGTTETQTTFVTSSDHGLWFDAVGPHAGALPIGPAYLRVFSVRGQTYAVGSGARLFRAADGDRWGFEATAPWAAGPRLLPVPEPPPLTPQGRLREAAVARHLAVELRGPDQLTVYFSRAGDAPERILAADVDVAGDWQGWAAGPVREVCRATERWQGARYPVQPSRGGIASGGVNQLRDPYVLVEANGTRNLFFTVQGEHALAHRRL